MKALHTLVVLAAMTLLACPPPRPVDPVDTSGVDLVGAPDVVTDTTGPLIYNTPTGRDFRFPAFAPPDEVL